MLLPLLRGEMVKRIRLYENEFAFDVGGSCGEAGGRWPAFGKQAQIFVVTSHYKLRARRRVTHHPPVFAFARPGHVRIRITCGVLRAYNKENDPHIPPPVCARVARPRPHLSKKGKN